MNRAIIVLCAYVPGISTFLGRNIINRISSGNDSWLIVAERYFQNDENT